MCEAGFAKAVVGNHEFNAIGWAATKEGGGFLRSHSAKNGNQHAKFLSEIGESSPTEMPSAGSEVCPEADPAETADTSAGIFRTAC
jgi:hypothetical protein